MLVLSNGGGPEFEEGQYSQTTVRIIDDDGRPSVIKIKYFFLIPLVYVPLTVRGLCCYIYSEGVAIKEQRFQYNYCLVSMWRVIVRIYYSSLSQSLQLFG